LGICWHFAIFNAGRFSLFNDSIIFIAIPRASVSAGRIAEVLETDVSIKNTRNPVKAPRRGGKVEFKNVTFTYPGAAEPVLHNVSFVALPGQTTAFIGSTGSGKSTILNLIPRFYDVTEGQILVDDVDIRDMRLQDLRARIGYVSQKAILFLVPLKKILLMVTLMLPKKKFFGLQPPLKLSNLLKN